MRNTQLVFGFMLLFFVSGSMLSCSGAEERRNEAKEEAAIKMEKDDDGWDKDKDDDDLDISGNITINGEEVDIEEAVNSITKALTGEHDEDLPEAVDFRDLKDLLPQRLVGIKRTDIEGERAGIGSLKFSTAKAEYDDGDAEFEVTIVDGGGIGAVITGMAAWSNIEVDSESDDGYERTTTIDGYKAYEKYDSRREDGSVAIFVEDRFIVTVEGRNVTEKQLKKALKAIDIDDLKRLGRKTI